MSAKSFPQTRLQGVELFAESNGDVLTFTLPRSDRLLKFATAACGAVFCLMLLQVQTVWSALVELALLVALFACVRALRTNRARILKFDAGKRTIVIDEVRRQARVIAWKELQRLDLIAQGAQAELALLFRDGSRLFLCSGDEEDVKRVREIVRTVQPAELSS